MVIRLASTNIPSACRGGRHEIGAYRAPAWKLFATPTVHSGRAAIEMRRQRPLQPAFPKTTVDGCAAVAVSSVCMQCTDGVGNPKTNAIDMGITGEPVSTNLQLAVVVPPHLLAGRRPTTCIRSSGPWSMIDQDVECHMQRRYATEHIKASSEQRLKMSSEQCFTSRGNDNGCPCSEQHATEQNKATPSHAKENNFRKSVSSGLPYVAL